MCIISRPCHFLLSNYICYSNLEIIGAKSAPSLSLILAPLPFSFPLYWIFKPRENRDEDYCFIFLNFLPLNLWEKKHLSPNKDIQQHICFTDFSLLFSTPTWLTGWIFAPFDPSAPLIDHFIRGLRLRLIRGLMGCSGLVNWQLNVYLITLQEMYIKWYERCIYFHSFVKRITPWSIFEFRPYFLCDHI